MARQTVVVLYVMLGLLPSFLVGWQMGKKFLTPLAGAFSPVNRIAPS